MIESQTESAQSASLTFQAWPKTPRLFRDMIVTEKIDGTNAAVIISAVGDDGDYLIGAQSRKRIITPEDDNFGFARWVHENADDLARLLGPGRHYGEWWGSGIQRGYGLQNGEKRFSLFNVKRYADVVQVDGVHQMVGLDVVPVMGEGPFDLVDVQSLLRGLAYNGSWAAPGFMRPEGVVVFHEAAGQVFKATLENDETPKGMAA